MNKLYLSIIALVFITSTGCVNNLKVISKQSDNDNIDLSSYILTQETLLDSLKQHPKTILVFWTDWCGCSKSSLKETFIPFSERIQKENLDIGLILVASDKNIPLKIVEQQRNKGISAFYLPKSGGHSVSTRFAIRKYLNEVFTNNNIPGIQPKSFAIPVKILVDDELNIIDETNSSIVYQFIKEQ